jgi:hypothetical protein
MDTEIYAMWREIFGAHHVCRAMFEHDPHKNLFGNWDRMRAHGRPDPHKNLFGNHQGKVIESRERKRRRREKQRSK